MKRKIRILIFLFILSFSFSVKADAFFDISCKDKNISSDSSITCDGNLIYENTKINDIEFEYETNLNISFKEINGFYLTKTGNKISVHANTPLETEDMETVLLFKIVLSSNSNSNDKETLTFKNIKINNSNSDIVEDISETFSIVNTAPILDTTNTLESITISETKEKESRMISNFDKNKLEYNVSVDHEMLYFDAIRTSENSTVEGLGYDRVSSGESIIHEIKVTAQNGSVRVYKINVTNSNIKTNLEDISGDNTLKRLELFYKNKKIDFVYDDSKDNFDVNVDNEVDKITIKAETNDPKATFAKKYGPRDITLKYGDNKVELKVYAENNSSKIYTLNINRFDERDSDNTLNSLKINGKEVLLNGEDNYEIILTGEVLRTEIEAIANSSKAKVEYEDINLADGDNNVTVSVIAENGESKEYHVNVRLEEEETEHIFEKIEIDGYNINFSKNVKSYNLKINNDVDELTIKVLPSNVSFEVFNNKKLENGSKVTIKVTDDNGEYEYIINIEKENSLINIICYSVFAIGVILFVLSIIRFIKKRKKSKI